MKKLLLLNTLIAYDNTAWKLDENGALVLKDGNPVYVDSSGQERTVGIDTIGRLNKEAKDHREAKEEALAKLKAFEGLDAAKARAALDTVSKLDQKQLIDAGKVDEVKNQITQQFQGQLSEKDTELQKMKTDFDNLIVSNIFANSEFLRNNLNVPRDMFEATFKNNFKVEDGQVAVYGSDGNRLFSKERTGEYATAEEGLQILTENHPQRDRILKANVGSGTGNSGAGGGSGGGRTIKRTDLAGMTPAKAAEISAKVRSGEIKLTD